MIKLCAIFSPLPSAINRRKHLSIACSCQRIYESTAKKNFLLRMFSLIAKANYIILGPINEILCCFRNKAVFASLLFFYLA